MSGLWSFGDNNAPLPSLSDSARKVLPTAVVNSDDDNDTNSMHTLINNNNINNDNMEEIEDLVNAFSITADVDRIVQEVQNEWFEKTVGCSVTTPYFLGSHQQQELSDFVKLPPEDNVSSLNRYELLDPEDMLVVRNLLKLNNDSDNKKKDKNNTCVKQREFQRPTESVPPTLHTAELASLREKRRALRVNKDTQDISVKAAPVESKFQDNKNTQKINVLHNMNYSNNKSTCKNERTNSKPKFCTFIDRMEKRVEQRRIGRCEQSAFRGSQIDFDDSSSILNSRNRNGKEIQQKYLLNKYMTLNNQNLYFSSKTFIDIDRGLDHRFHEYEIIADKLKCIKLKRVVWRYWNQNMRRRQEKYKDNTVHFIKGKTSVIYSHIPVEFITNTQDSVSLIETSIESMKLLRWYFVVWVAVVEAVRNQHISEIIS